MAMASSSEIWNHDVFVSFRGEDTRKTFVDHLYSALLQQGIRTFKDDESLPRGESIAPALSNAIQQSRIALIVFSQNYADSSWCLEELACIMNCKDSRGQIVMPIFYDVDPSDVRKQKRKFGEAFAKHHSDNNYLKVESWRKALVDASNISGWELKHVANGYETKGIKEIVDAISNRLFPLISNLNEDLVGMWTRVQDLKSRLEIGLGGVLMVGIWGVGGGGKTTLASSVYDEISSKFDCCCFVENIREESSNGLEKLQEKLLSDILEQNQVRVGRVHKGKTMIRSRLCHKKVLIVLDDVDHLDQLWALAGSHDWFGEGSRIIITTRDNHLLNAHKVNVIYNITLLDDVEAIQLFRKHASCDCRTIADYETLSKDVITYSGGLPLALKILGCFLCDKDVNEWRSALARLKEIPDTNIVEKLKISYDGLTQFEKELFLDIACFFRGNDKNIVMGILDACGFHAVIGVKVLMQKALITISDQAFDMHDLVQEMGRYIVRAEHPKNPEKHSRIWKKEDVRRICSIHATMQNDTIGAIKFVGFWVDSPDLANQVLSNMKKLRCIICLDYPAILLPAKFHPMDLCYLKLRGEFKQLWVDYKHLPCLKVLDLDFSINLIETPDFSGLPCLERVILVSCINLKEIHPSIGYHERLKYLDMSLCDSLEMFPPIICMKKLETLKISRCSRLHKFLEIQMNMDSLVELKLAGSGIEVVPSSIGEYCTNLVSLDLSYSFRLKSIEANFGLLKQLKSLKLQGCRQLDQAPSPLFFPVKLPHFPHFLTSLNLSYCKLVDGDIPSGISYLSNLKSLDLSGNNFYQLYPYSLSQFPRLKILNLSYCHKLLTLPDLPSSMAILYASECHTLKIIDNFQTNCKWLWKVSLQRKKKLHRIDVKRVVESMLQGNATEDYFMSLRLGHVDIPVWVLWGYQSEIFRLQLPYNWDSDFTGFFIRLDGYESYEEYKIVIKQQMHIDYESDLLQGFDETAKIDRMSGMCYISFGWLRLTSWWDSTYTQISFQIPDAKIQVELVPRKKCKACDKVERSNGTAADCSEFWDGEYGNRKTFTIINDSKSSLEIEWWAW